MSQPYLGITVMPEWIQAESIDRVLNNLRRAGATAVATSPYVMAPSDAPDAGREPPIDAGSGSVRLLDRTLWGRRELRCTTAPSFVPDTTLYAGLAYQPAEPTELTRREGAKIARFIKQAKEVGLEVHLQVQAAIPPGYRVQFGGPRLADAPRLPDGSVYEGRVDKNGSLASPAIRDYTKALLKDIAGAYPMIDAVRIDWPEYPPYSLQSWFFDFCDHALGVAKAKGYDIERMRRDCFTLMSEPQRFLTEGLEPLPGFAKLQAFKADLVVDFVKACRCALPADKKLIAHAFPDPWCRLSGMNIARIGTIADELAVKLYTMHWPMMIGGYLDGMLQEDANLDRAAATKALNLLFDTGAKDGVAMLYPEPDEPHPVGTEAQIRKIQSARASGTMITPAAHSYGPMKDVDKRVRTAFWAGGKRVWVNRYGYLSDGKLDALGEMMQEAA